MAIVWARSVAATLPDFIYDCQECTDSVEDHFKLGSAIGSKYRDTIQKRVAVHIATLAPFLKTDAGKKVYEEFLTTHRKRVPKLVAEMQGIAHGSNISFPQMFAVSLSEEIGYFASPSTFQLKIDGCSDYVLCNEKHCVGGHNEDGAYADHEMFTAVVRFGSSNFTTLNYAGDLLGGMSAFAFNADGLAFSLNYVAPRICTTDGLGRNYVSRQLLDAHTWDDAVSVISQKHAAGHNYQLMDFRHRRIASMEAANNVYSSVAVTEPFFHANQYTVLNVPGQIFANSSIHRLARVKQLPLPKDGNDILKILGDQKDHSYPIFHDKVSHAHGDLSDWTLATALFDLDAGTVSVMDGNPANLVAKRVFHVAKPSQPVIV